MSSRRNVPQLKPGFDRTADGKGELRGSLLVLDVGLDGLFGADSRVALILVDHSDNYLIDVGDPGRSHDLLVAADRVGQVLECCHPCNELLRQLVRDGWEHGASKLAAVVTALSHLDDDGDVHVAAPSS